MARSKSSGRWLQAHVNDHYVKRAKKEGWRSRASYKLLEIQEKDHVIQQGMNVVDLGAAPGGWSQVAVGLVGDHGRVVASDILAIDPLPSVDFIQGDFTDEIILEKIIQTIGTDQVDLVISDMAPNMSGMLSIDQPRSMHLVELALDMARQVLKKNGLFLTKVFQGEGFETYLKDVRSSFNRVQTRKPKASRPRSREVYLLAREFKG
ncbi:MAG: 23S rRNA (uridine(2552)-2'-O)-methyltransferase RlmE [Endozoicomonas sp. (ex Botrylloides leachii)]|nr:23S rRNA (uridine(2552)-2'-O)-methyltransferase RlmE [Endozoicomonas sp. (ex Botrylloides leachii)]